MRSETEYDQLSQHIQGQDAPLAHEAQQSTLFKQRERHDYATLILQPDHTRLVCSRLSVRRTKNSENIVGK